MPSPPQGGVAGYMICLVQDDVARRLKAWCLKGLDAQCDSKQHHVFYTAVPPLSAVGSDDDLNRELQRLTASRSNP